MQSNCFKWRLISLLPQCLRLIANRESRIDFNRSQPGKKERKKCWKKWYIIIKANGPQTCPSNDDDDDDDAAVSVPVDAVDDDDEPWVGECGINIYEFAESLFFFLYFSTRLCKKGSAWGRKTLKAKKKRSLHQISETFSLEEAKSQTRQTGTRTERGDDTTRIVTSRAALWHAFDGLTCGPRFPDPSSRYLVPGTRYPLLDHSRSLGYF